MLDHWLLDLFNHRGKEDGTSLKPSLIWAWGLDCMCETRSKCFSLAFHSMIVQALTQYNKLRALINESGPWFNKSVPLLIGTG